MDKLGVAEIQQVVGNELVIGLHLDKTPDQCERRILVAAEVGNLGCIRLFNVPHPQPDHFVPFDQGIRGNSHTRRDHPVTMRVQYAFSICGIAQAMVRTLNRVADQLAHAQRGEAMGAGVADGDCITILLSIEDDRLIKQRSLEHGAPHFVRPGSHVPSIVQILGVTHLSLHRDGKRHRFLN